MPGTQRPYRPYFYNFLAAFRAHHAFRSAAAASTTATSSSSAAAAATFTTQQQQQQQQQQQSPQQQSTSGAHSNPYSNTTAAPRPITHKPTRSTGVSGAFSPPATHHRPRAAAHAHASPGGAGTGTGAGNSGPGAASSPRAGRRGSDASSEGGFRERVGGEAWFVGGRTANGEERFYRLGMVRRERSGERASVDRMSL